MSTYAFVAAFLAGSLGMSLAGAQVPTAAQSLGEKWPLTVTDVVMRCEVVGGDARLQAVTATYRGDTFAVNGVAKGQAGRRGWRDINAIWKANPDIPGTKMNMGPLVEYGQLLCARPAQRS